MEATTARRLTKGQIVIDNRTMQTWRVSRPAGSGNIELVPAAALHLVIPPSLMGDYTVFDTNTNTNTNANANTVCEAGKDTE